ncbi:hypothetical protein M153_38210001608, partial [Pseudoloma neurophilia]
IMIDKTCIIISGKRYIKKTFSNIPFSSKKPLRGYSGRGQKYFEKSS